MRSERSRERTHDLSQALLLLSFTDRKGRELGEKDRATRQGAALLVEDKGHRPRSGASVAMIIFHFGNNAIPCWAQVAMILFSLAAQGLSWQRLVRSTAPPCAGVCSGCVRSVSLKDDLRAQLSGDFGCTFDERTMWSASPSARGCNCATLHRSSALT